VRIAIFAAASTRLLGGIILPLVLRLLPGAEGIGKMKKLRSLLRVTPSRIGRRLAMIVAIAAASLPDAGA
jgi:hypothetical protein